MLSMERRPTEEAPFNIACFACNEGYDDAPLAGCRLPLAEGLTPALLSHMQDGCSGTSQSQFPNLVSGRHWLLHETRNLHVHTVMRM